jgi:hypothetical protein
MYETQKINGRTRGLKRNINSFRAMDEISRLEVIDTCLNSFIVREDG